MIKPEDCTKEELVYFISKTLFFNQDRFDSDIRLFRINHYAEKANEEFEKSQKLTEEYLEYIRKYTGMKMVDIPLDDLKRIAYLEKEKEKHYKKSNEYWEKSRMVRV